MLGFIADDARHGRAAIEVNRLLEDRVNRSGRVAHVVLSDLTRGIGQAVGEHVRRRIEQQSGAFDRVPGNADDARLLALRFPSLSA